MVIQFSFQKLINFRNRKRVKLFLQEICYKEQKQISEINYIFCDNNFILNINTLFLKHKYLTDIITFNLSQNPEKEIIGEIYIGVDTVKINSRCFNTSFQNELMRVIIHGVLHLCGYHDRSSEEKALMTKKENFYLQLFYNC